MRRLTFIISVLSAFPIQTKCISVPYQYNYKVFMRSLTFFVFQNFEPMENFKLETCAHELSYRNELFRGDYGKILDMDIRCTVCAADLNWMVSFKKQIVKHPLFEVILCEGCLEPHKCTDWSNVCLWCGIQKPSTIIRCCFCPAEFCESCIKVNFGLKEIVIARLSGYKCFMCDKKKLRIFRAICDAAEKLTNEFRELDKLTVQNSAMECCCCKAPFKKIKQLNCGHKFHLECFEQWVKKNRICPLCRAAIPIQQKN